MPKRVIDFDALWASDKLASCAEWAQSEYAWLYGLADASGSFEITNLRVIWGRVAAIRKNLTLERLQQVFDEFIARGLLFTWEENGKRYGHWTGSDVPGRLPPPSWRARLEKLAPPVPRKGLAAYSGRFGGSKEAIVARTGACPNSRPPVRNDAQPSGLKHALEEDQAQLKEGLEETQAQDWDLDLNKNLEKEVSSEPQQTRLLSCARAFARDEGRSLGTLSQPPHVQEQHAVGTAPAKLSAAIADRTSPVHAELREIAAAEWTPEELLEIYEEERGPLPPAGAMTPERWQRCERCFAAGLTPEEFRAAVRCAVTTPFLAGNGNRGWQASFDWLIANRNNVRKVLGGEYDPHRRGQAGKSRLERRGIADLYAGAGPRAADCGVRVNPAALERILTRRAELQSRGAQSQRVLAPDLTQIDEGAPFPTPSGTASPSFASTLTGADLNDTAAKSIACDAQARASPKALKF